MTETRKGCSSELRTRVFSAVIAIPLFLLMLWLGTWFFGAVILALLVLSVNECLHLFRQINSENRVAMLIIALAYLLLGYLSLFSLRIHFNTWLVALWLLVTVWITDSGAYFVGKRYGKHHPVPNISPNKTWEGFIGGAVCGTVLAALVLVFALDMNYFLAMLLTLLVSTAGQLGDLLESKIKRMAGVKDSGKLLPGHGGALDRFDSILLASHVALILLSLL